MQMLLLLAPATAGLLLLVNYFLEFGDIVTFMHTGSCCCHIHFFFVLPSLPDFVNVACFINDVG